MICRLLLLVLILASDRQQVTADESTHASGTAQPVSESFPSILAPRTPLPGLSLQRPIPLPAEAAQLASPAHIWRYHSWGTYIAASPPVFHSQKSITNTHTEESDIMPP